MTTTPLYNPNRFVTGLADSSYINKVKTVTFSYSKDQVPVPVEQQTGQVVKEDLVTIDVFKPDI